jgi:hypothetical protein
MYHLATNDNWFNGMKFTSLAEAVKKQREILAREPYKIVDIMRHEDGQTTRVVATSDGAEQNIVLLRR